jgi:hypothetical protein
MRIVAIEGVQHFQINGGSGGSNNMLIELANGEQYRVPIGDDTYAVLSELGKVSAMQAHQQEPDLSQYMPQQTPATKQPTKQRLDRSPQPGQIPQTLGDFAKGFITGPNQGAAPAPPQMTAEQQELVGQLSSLSDNEVTELAEDPLSQLRKIGMFGEPTDIMSSLESTSATVQGSDVIESFEDTSEDDEYDPGEEYDDDDEIADQY